MILLDILTQAWNLFVASSVYILLGLFVSGLVWIFVSPQTIGKHLGKGRFLPVLKAAFFGIPLPLCSCGVLPAAVGLKKQGANNGAVTSFMIATPESGVDSIAVTYALTDPILTVARPAAAFATAVSAGILENVMGKDKTEEAIIPVRACPVDGCCDGVGCDPAEHEHHHGFFSKFKAGIRYAVTEVWQDMAGWFFIGLLLAGLILAVVPDDFMGRYLGGGLGSMLMMLVVGIPIYICATASTPVAAAMILKGVSPGAALVFLLAGPATNVTSLSVLFGLLGKRATAIYLSTIAFFAVGFGLLTDWIYRLLDVSPQAVVGRAAEVIPEWAGIVGAILLLAFSIKPISQFVKASVIKHFGKQPRQEASHCGCSSCAHDGQGNDFRISPP